MADGEKVFTRDLVDNGEFVVAVGGRRRLLGDELARQEISL